MREEEHSFASAALGNERKIWVAIPHEGETPPQLLLILDAEIYREKVHAPAVLEQLRERREIAPCLVVYVSHHSPEARWRECPCYPPFAAFLAHELMPWISERYPQTNDASEQVLLGLSYTGLAASFAALQNEDAFTKVISQSGSYWSDDCWLARGVERRGQRPPTAFYLSVGQNEVQERIRHKPDLVQEMSQIAGVERFRDALQSVRADVSFTLFDGGHHPDGWRSDLPTALKWALPTS